MRFYRVHSDDDRAQYEALGWEIRQDKAGISWVKPVAEEELEGNAEPAEFNGPEDVQETAYLQITEALEQQGFQCIGPANDELIADIRRGGGKAVVIDGMKNVADQVWARLN